MKMAGRTGCLALWAVSSLFSTTLEKLSLDDMILKSTEIVRGKVTGIGSLRRGALIVTQVSVSVSERWKGGEASTVEVFLHGGTFQGLRQTFSGTPELREGGEYVFFLWAGKSGNRQIIGLSQGVLDIQSPVAASKPAQPGALAVRAAIPGMLDPATHREVADAGISIPLDQLRSRVLRTLSQEKQ
jgi:hypothetical protein